MQGKGHKSVRGRTCGALLLILFLPVWMEWLLQTRCSSQHHKSGREIPASLLVWRRHNLNMFGCSQGGKGRKQGKNHPWALQLCWHTENGQQKMLLLIEYPGMEGTHKGHRVQFLALHRASSRATSCPWEHFQTVLEICQAQCCDHCPGEPHAAPSHRLGEKLFPKKWWDNLTCTTRGSKHCTVTCHHISLCNTPGSTSPS